VKRVVAFLRARQGILIPLGCVAALAFVAWFSWAWAAGRLSTDPVRITAEETFRRVLLETRDLRRERPAVTEALNAFGAKTLGSTVPEVDSALRSRLNRIGELEGLANLTVGTSGASARPSPAANRFTRSGDQRALREEIDLVEVGGWISGRGTLEQALRTMLRIESEPWLKRIDSVRLDAGASGDTDRITLTVRLTTILVPGRAPIDPPAEIASAEVARVAAILDRSPFRMPPPPPAPEPPRQRPTRPPPPPPPPPFPYGDWVLTGIAVGPAGPEAWLHNRRSGERRILTPGEGLDEMVLAVTASDAAEFAVGDTRVRVSIGHALNDRTPVSQ